MADRKIDYDKAIAWQKDVANEIAEVNKALQKVNAVCLDMPNKDDVIVQMIEKTGNYMETAWKNTTQVFETAWNGISDAIKTIGEKGSQVLGKFEEFLKTLTY